MTEQVLLTPAELSALIDKGGVVVIDTRAPAAYQAGHIPGAVNIHDIFTYLAMSTREAMQQLQEKFADAFGSAGLGGEETAVFYEESMTTGFGQSCRGYFLLKFLGYPSAAVLHGGFQGWKAAGMPVTTDIPTVTPKPFPASDSGLSMMLDRDDMLSSVGDDGIVKLDVRDVDEWIADSSSPYGKDYCPRKGRIPGAVWLEWYRVMKPTPEGPMFKTKNEILAECHTVGISADTPVYVYCFKGARASNTLVALKEAGIKDVRLYFGSWNEWSRDESLPIEGGLPWAPNAG